METVSAVTPASQEAQETTPAQTRDILAPNVLLERAQKSFEGGDVAQSIAFLNQHLEDYPQGIPPDVPGGSDEVYWLLGQFYEANSPSRNILLSIDYYKRLVNEYPQSSRFNDARRRIAYLERFYINIQ
jgi:outer membrane protein assembly factor BamD (BamD/ComL family)